MCYDSSRYEWARRTARMKAERDRVEALRAEVREARKKDEGNRQPAPRFPWSLIPDFFR
jgi:hypothetical protein